MNGAHFRDELAACRPSKETGNADEQRGTPGFVSRMLSEQFRSSLVGTFFFQALRVAGSIVGCMRRTP